MKYVEEKNHELRYTLKDVSTGRVYLVVVFSVVLCEKEDKKDHTDQDKSDDGNLGQFEGLEASSGDVER